MSEHGFPLASQEDKFEYSTVLRPRVSETGIVDRVLGWSLYGAVSSLPVDAVMDSMDRSANGYHFYNLVIAGAAGAVVGAVMHGVSLYANNKTKDGDVSQ